ncbi:hypothetical protein [Edaphobacter acidisoli]|nr:hypothetical protein [Edaphobacter acidisoli]
MQQSTLHCESGGAGAVEKAEAWEGSMSDGKVTADELREMFREPLRLDGMQLCAGCEDAFVLSGYCASCQRLAAEYARKEQAARQSGLFRAQPRLDAGVVAFEPVRRRMHAAADVLLLLTGFTLALLSPWLFELAKMTIAWLYRISQ